MKLMFTSAVILACTAACSAGNDSSTDPQSASSSAALVAEVDNPFSEPFQIRINGQWQVVTPAPDGSFVLDALPTGDVTIEISARGQTTQIVIRDVRASETLTISLTIGDVLRIEIVARDRDRAGDISSSDTTP